MPHGRRLNSTKSWFDSSEPLSRGGLWLDYISGRRINYRLLRRCLLVSAHQEPRARHGGGGG